jgi:transcription elongation GreA/GreB family factor
LFGFRVQIEADVPSNKKIDEMSTNKLEINPHLTHITRTGYSKIDSEMEILRTIRHIQISRHSQDVMRDAERPEYILALEDQVVTQGRIPGFEEIHPNCQITEPGPTTGLGGSRGKVVIRENGSYTETYTFIGSVETGPGAGLISKTLPLGPAPLDCKIGTEVQVKATGGFSKFKVVAV